MLLQRYERQIHNDFKLKVNAKTSKFFEEIQEIKANIRGYTNMDTLKEHSVLINQILRENGSKARTEIITNGGGRHPNKYVWTFENGSTYSVPINGDTNHLGEGVVKNGIMGRIEEVLFETLSKTQVKEFNNRLKENTELMKINEPHVTDSAIYIDTCSMLQLVKDRVSIKQKFKSLSTSFEGISTVILMNNVIEEFERNLDLLEVTEVSKVKNEWAEIKSLIESNLLRNVTIQNVLIAREYVEELSEVMKNNSEKGNSRVGEGEASIFLHIKEYGELFQRVYIYSSDTDVKYLKNGLKLENVEVRTQSI